MSDKSFCDRCGVELEWHKKFSFRKVAMKATIEFEYLWYNTYADSHSHSFNDLCLPCHEECEELFRKFMNPEVPE